jgi:hypothetical protein
MNAAMMAGSGKKESRQEFDFYPTPEDLTEGLLQMEDFTGSIWECASGNGRISRVIERVYPDRKIHSSDVRTDDTVYGDRGVNFLKCYHHPVDNIITNPPFIHATEFILIAKKIARYKIAFLLKLAALGGDDRYQRVWSDKKFPLKKIIVFVNRVDFLGFGGASIEYAWFIWDKYYLGEPAITWYNNKKATVKKENKDQVLMFTEEDQLFMF